MSPEKGGYGEEVVYSKEWLYNQFNWMLAELNNRLGKERFASQLRSLPEDQRGFFEEGLENLRRLSNMRQLKVSDGSSGRTLVVHFYPKRRMKMGSRGSGFLSVHLVDESAGISRVEADLRFHSPGSIRRNPRRRPLHRLLARLQEDILSQLRIDYPNVDPGQYGSDHMIDGRNLTISWCLFERGKGVVYMNREEYLKWIDSLRG